jgi:hypothetical protein
MPAPKTELFALCAAAATAIIACSQVNGSAPLPAAYVARMAAPPQCERQRTARKYAQLKVRLRKRAGSFCIPEFRGFGGTMQYPGVERPVVLVLRSSIKNIYDEPQLGSGTAIFYLNLHFLAGTHFGTRLRSEGGLTAKKIEVGQPYTAFGIVTVGHLVLMFPPCYAIATSGPYGGILSNLGELFVGTTITGAGYGVIEIYSGEQVTRQC